MLRKFELFERVEKLSPDVFAKVKNDRKVDLRKCGLLLRPGV